LRVDLHNHTEESSAVVRHWVAQLAGASECYVRAKDSLFQATRVRGLDAIAITNHDAIGDALALAERHPESVIVGCEYSVAGGDGYLLHVVVLDVTPALHATLDRVRAWGLAPFCREVKAAGRPYFLAHVAWGTFHERPMTPVVVEEWLQHFELIETLNSTRTRENDLAAKLARYYGKTGVGGSDGHELGSIGRAWTEAPAARTPREFLAAMLARDVVAGGEGGGVEHFGRTIRGIALGFYASEWDRVRDAGGLVAYAGRATAGDWVRHGCELAFAPALPLFAHVGSLRQVEALERDVARLEAEFTAHLRARAIRRALDEPDATVAEREALLARELARIADAFGTDAP